MHGASDHAYALPGAHKKRGGLSRLFESIACAQVFYQALCLT
jgi:hypothetical protein